MAFTVTPTTVDAGILESGQSVDLPVVFDGVPPDVTGGGTVTFALDGTTIDVAVSATADNPDPVVTSIVVPQSLQDQGVSVTVPQIDAAGATIRVARA